MNSNDSSSSVVRQARPKVTTKSQKHARPWTGHMAVMHHTQSQMERAAAAARAGRRLPTCMHAVRHPSGQNWSILRNAVCGSLSKSLKCERWLTPTCMHAPVSACMHVTTTFQYLPSTTRPPTDTMHKIKCTREPSN